MGKFIDKKWKRRFYWQESLSRQNDSRIWLSSYRTPSNSKMERISIPIKEIFCQSDLRILLENREMPFEPLTPSRKTQNTRNLVML